MKSNLKYGFLLLLIGLVSGLYAQKEINHNVVVMKNYSPVIGSADRLSEMPQIVDTSQVELDFKYNISSTPFYSRFSPVQIKPATMIGEPLKKLYHSFVKVGFGNYTKPLFEFRYATKRSKNLLVGVDIKHLSQNGKLKLKNVEDKVYSGYSHNRVGVFLNQYFKNSVLETDATYNRFSNRFYGHNAATDTVIDKNDNKQYFSWMHVAARYKSTKVKHEKLTHESFIEYNYFEDKYNTFANHVGLGSGFILNLKKEQVGLDFDFNYYHQNSSMIDYSNSVFRFHPKVIKQNDKWGINAGLDFFVDANMDSTKFHFYPKISLHYNVVDYYLVPYVEIWGTLKTNHYRSIALENPFVKPGLIVQNANSWLNIKAGFRGKFTETLSYNINATYGLEDGAHFFVNDSLNPTENQFIVEYDNVEKYTVSAELNWLKSRKLQFSFLARYNGFKLDSLEHAWHMPDYDLIFSTNYNLKNKILVNLDLFVKGKRYAKSYYNKEASQNYSVVTIPGTFDVNLGLEYRYTKMLSGFIRFNNILARKNYLWNYYPTEGFNAMLGITYSF